MGLNKELMFCLPMLRLTHSCCHGSHLRVWQLSPF